MLCSYPVQGRLSTRADQDTGGALLGFSTRTDMHGSSHVSSAISVGHICRSFTTAYSPEAVARLVRRWIIDQRVPPGESYSPLVDCACIYHKISFGYDFYQFQFYTRPSRLLNQ